MMTENELVKKCLQNNGKAFEELYRRYAPKMLGVCMRYAKCRAEAEDFLQEGFIRIFENIGQYKNEGSFEGWMRRIFVHTSINHYKANSRSHASENIDEFVNEENDIACDTIIADISAQDLLNYIQELPNGYRMVFNLFAIEGYSHKEISNILNISENTSKSQLFMARKTLQKKITEVYGITVKQVIEKKNITLKTG